MDLHLSEGEWKLMNVLWAQAPRTVTEIVAALHFDTGWTKHTVITMLSRLENKGAVRFEQGERAKQFYPCVEKNALTVRETESFLDRVYGGSVGLMVNTLLHRDALSTEEVAELRRMLDQAEGTK